ncbi:MAG: hypothetical protein WCY30_02345 [Candidatus Neomarinimicrobiota bacterium]|jgi:hypothetical protein
MAYELEDYLDDIDDFEGGLTSCPKCGRDYDDADYDSRICHFCCWDADNDKYVFKKLFLNIYI